MAELTEFTAENVEKAVNNFYCNASMQQEVHRWLTAAQVSPQAWSFCWNLLSPEKGLQVQYFGASCLHTKISRYWQEVPADQIGTLRSQLLEQVAVSATGPKLILTRLCVALSSLAIQLMPDAWPNCIDELIVILQNDSSPLSSTQRCTVLLEIFTVLPEEFFSMSLTNAKRSSVRYELSQNMVKILALLTNLMSPNSPKEVYEHALKCFASWVEFGVPMNEAEGIIVQVFQSLNSEHLFDTAVDTIVKVFSHGDSHKFSLTIQKLMPLVLQLKEMLNNAIMKHDIDVCQGVAQIVVALAENHTKILLESACGDDDNKKSDALKLVSLVLECSSVPGHYPIDEQCSSLTFTFWYILQDNLQDLPVEKYHQLLPMFQPVYLSLIENLLIKVQYPPDDLYSSWSAEEKEQFRCYRQDIGDTMMYAYCILREPLLGYLCNALASLVRMEKELDIRWELMEAIFFLFGSVAESVDLEEALYLPAVLDLLPKIPFNNIKFISTALSMLGSFGEWMSYHPQSLTTAIPLLLQGLESPEAAQAASMALKDITRENLDHIRPYVHQILQACQAALARGHLKSRENVRLMSCIGQVLSVLPYSDIIEQLNPILIPHIAELEQLAKQQPSGAVKNSILLKLNMLSWLFSSLDTDREMSADKPKKEGPKPVFMILQQIAPILQTIVSNWINDTGVIESVCEMFKRSLQTLMDDFAPLAKDTAELLTQIYQAVPHIAILELTKQLLLVFNTEPDFEPAAQALVRAIVTKTQSLFLGDLSNIQQNTDVVEAFMIMLAQTIKKTKQIVFDSGIDISSLFQAGLVGMSLPENHTVKASCIFLCELLSQASVPVVKEAVLVHGPVLLDRIMRAIGGESPRLVMEHIADVLFSLCKNYLSEVRGWCQDFVSREDYPSPRCTTEDKDRFMKSVMRERVSKTKVRTLVKEFTLLCRGLLGTEYASQIAEQVL
ncbi:importin-13-like [Mya arenaria]|uniref:importin-13-like n=1 Tax=Mya arenaria TaxID=6604 RepID=UPI0022DF9E49|nr:importin-13-like [Mya arenaria]